MLDSAVKLAVGVPALVALTFGLAETVKKQNVDRAQSRSISGRRVIVPIDPASENTLDPARSEITYEFLMDGEEILDVPLQFGGSLQVSKHPASMNEREFPPDNPPTGVKLLQEWRCLRFTPAEGSTNLVQSVTKVIVAPEGCEQWDPSVQMRPEAMPLHYTKSFATVVLSTLAAMGAPVYGEAAAENKEPLRFLCIGLGGGTVPAFLARACPDAEVDCVELEPAVVLAATTAMGFVPTEKLRVHTADGVDWALRAAEEFGGKGGAYNAVLVDAYDAAGNVPETFRCAGGGLPTALANGLLRPKGLVATNFLPGADLREPLEVYRSALAERIGTDPGPGFSISAEGTANLIAVQPSVNIASGPEGSLPYPLYAPWFIGTRLELTTAAIQIEESSRAPFNMAKLAARNLQAWPRPGEEEAD